MTNKYRIPCKCTICGHFNYEIVKLSQEGLELKHIKWKYDTCKCPKMCELGGYKSIESAEIHVDLTDKNGEEIYERDLIKYYGNSIPQHSNKDTIYEVEYSLNEFIATPIEYKYDKGYGDYCGGGHLKDWLISSDREVIGNVLENPEITKFY